LAFSHVLTVATRRQLIPAKVTVELYADKNIQPGARCKRPRVPLRGQPAQEIPRGGREEDSCCMSG
jgi:hypothetical protein